MSTRVVATSLFRQFSSVRVALQPIWTQRRNPDAPRQRYFSVSSRAQASEGDQYHAFVEGVRSSPAMQKIAQNKEAMDALQEVAIIMQKKGVDLSKRPSMFTMMKVVSDPEFRAAAEKTMEVLKKAGVEMDRELIMKMFSPDVEKNTVHSQSYAARRKNHTNPAAVALLEVMERKKSNLCVSVDVTKKESFLRIIDAAGPSVCMVKTHIDIIEDFDEDLVVQLTELSKKHDFVIFEDRKFADIGNTVMLQYSSGVHKIASWSHITNAHPVPGPSIIKGLASVGLPLDRGLLLLAEMSSEGTLAKGDYTNEAIEMARAHRDFVIGFIAMKRLGTSARPHEDFLILTPGVGLDTKGDGMGQQYKTPREVILERGCDVIIVGRGIYGKGDGAESEVIRREAERYRSEGWKAYEERVVA
ncbi:orotidine 5'-phosphate decarboxylase [Tulasnella sp. 403]|nr:orotidine 5'-phosphate decarboxylase [Tulasnella sp. 403]